MKTKWWKMIEIVESFTMRMKKTTSHRETFWLQLKRLVREVKVHLTLELVGRVLGTRKQCQFLDLYLMHLHDDDME